MPQRFDPLAQVGRLRHGRAQGRSRAIATQQQAARVRAREVVRTGKGDRRVREIRIHEGRVEMQRRARAFRGIQQQDVQVAARDRTDHFGLVEAVALQVGVSIERMHHPAAHHHRLRQYRVGQ